jgi:hypothetical protein
LIVLKLLACSEFPTTGHLNVKRAQQNVSSQRGAKSNECLWLESRNLNAWAWVRAFERRDARVVQKDRWMNGWMDGLMDEWMVG